MFSDAVAKVMRVRWSSDLPDDQFDVDNPATGEVICRVQGGGAREVDLAVRAAHAAFGEWRWLSARERGAILRKAGLHLAKHAQELASLVCQENGKPVADALKMDIHSLLGSFAFFADLAEQAGGEFSDYGPFYTATVREPYGVVAGIIPFNWPPIHTGAKVAPALAAGNAVVLKPGEQAPLTIMRIVELLQEVLPPDLVHVVPGVGPTVGQALTVHPLVRKISFTGAPATGTAVLKAAADRHTPVLLELGGKNPYIVFADADLDLAVADAVDAAFFNKGEACTAASRFLVHESVHDAFVARLAKAVQRLIVGDGAVPTTHVGPLVSAAQRDKVLRYIELGVAEGAKIIAQAPLPTEARLNNGYFVAPTLFVNVKSDMRIAQEEIFGPVACVIPFVSEDEAVEIANGTDFGLVAAVYSRDSEIANRVARRLEAGIVFINNYRRGLLGTPFGGVKASGYGREHSAQTLTEYSYLKALRIPSGKNGPVPQWRAVGDVTA